MKEERDKERSGAQKFGEQTVFAHQGTQFQRKPHFPPSAGNICFFGYTQCMYVCMSVCMYACMHVCIPTVAPDSQCAQASSQADGTKRQPCQEVGIDADRDNWGPWHTRGRKPGTFLFREEKFEHLARLDWQGRSHREP